MRLLGLPEEVKRYLADGRISAGHARALLAHGDPEALAKAIVEKGLSVREAELLAQARAEARGRAPRRRSRLTKSADIRALEKSLSDVLGLAVEIVHRGTSGELRVRYKTVEQLDALCRKLSAKH
jgi:ParB family chromosome partitioning protein